MSNTDFSARPGESAWDYTTRWQREHERAGNIQTAQELRKARWFLFPNGPDSKNWDGSQ